jgi:cyclohexanone monooxygenase
MPEPHNCAPAAPAPDFDVAIVGAGFAGMYMLHRLRSLGFRVRVFEAGGDVGGTWYWNRYPGARCDVESIQYSYQFDPALEQEWDWSERYAAQPELLRYARHVAKHFDLNRDIQFNTAHDRGSFDAALGCGCSRQRSRPRHRALLHHGNGLPLLAQPAAFQGSRASKVSATTRAQWPHEDVDFTGKRVAVIGTGSSAVQSIPIIARQAKHLFVFQRTPNYAVPAHNRAARCRGAEKAKADYPAMRRRAKQTMTGIDFDY